LDKKVILAGFVAIKAVEAFLEKRMNPSVAKVEDVADPRRQG